MNAQEMIETQVIFPWTHIQMVQEVNTSEESSLSPSYMVNKRMEASI